jgi:ribosome-binding factor A
MSREYGRHVRVGDQIQRVVANIITTRLKDPRLNLVTVSKVDVSRDLRNATIHVSSLSETDGQAIEHALNKASGLLRGELGHVLNTRGTPKLHFVYDTHIRNAVELVSRIEQAVANDEAKRKDNE